MHTALIKSHSFSKLLSKISNTEYIKDLTEGASEGFPGLLIGSLSIKLKAKERQLIQDHTAKELLGQFILRFVHLFPIPNHNHSHSHLVPRHV